MKVWLYYRLSRDEDEELNSLSNQRKIIYNYAVSNGHEVVGESFDDNVSGMHFNRPGIDRIYEAVESGLMEAVVVKDLSRLGRHRTQTALFIDYLREHDIRVLSATENIDTFNENDDLIIGFKGLVNDFYARDGSRRVRTGYRQKQKEGIVIIPPFGYFKDKNTKQEYRCDTYHCYGKEHCTAHTVDEDVLDELITKELLRTKRMYQANFQSMEGLIEQWRPKATTTAAQVKKLADKITKLEEEMEAILMERIRDKANAERYDRMIQKRETEIAAAKRRIQELQNIEATLRSRQSKLKRDIGMMDDILKEGKLSEAHLRMLVDKIYVHEEDGKLSLDIRLKAPFQDHLDIYESGRQTECLVPQEGGFERLESLIMTEALEVKDDNNAGLDLHPAVS